VMEEEAPVMEEEAPVMEGEDDVIEEQIPEIKEEGGAIEEPVDEWLYYTVQNGDYGGGLLQKLGCTKEELCEWNNLNLATWSTNSGGLKLNQVLKYKK